MSAIGREGGHSRGRARQSSQPVSQQSGSSTLLDTERPSFGHERVSDRGSLNQSGVSARSDRGTESTNRSQVNPVSGRNQY
jgi:hypothetical protein